jgi:RNA polymerase sigma factor (sigma-70 family)
MLNFAEIYSMYYNAIYKSIMFKLNGKKEIAEELTNDVFVKVSCSLNEFDSEKSSLKTWLHNISKNTLIDYWRKKQLEVVNIESFVNSDGDVYFEIASNDTPYDNINNKEIYSKIERAINSLPKIYRRIAILFFIKQYTYEEICNELNLPLGTVKGQLSRSKEMLKCELNGLIK